MTVLLRNVTMTYDAYMSTKPVTATLEADLLAYVQEQVNLGRARSVSAYLNAALERQIAIDRRADAAWKAAVEKAQQNPEEVEKARRRAQRLIEILNGG
ncbi:hypothetical protein Aros01_01212 [Streptosporangium roseum]|uniref:Uncharacterized protein n=2 Tax=Streptosporangium roseum TaxID=2001 RepID=D2ARU5_STRRD|nr:hypothetical protein Sros_1633 [Streptosporangium roseum DSM 43021]